jgi:hypothetical protein
VTVVRLGWAGIALAVNTLAIADVSIAADTRALVVGVAGYPNLAQSLRLQGPRNDTREVIATLVSLGIDPANIAMLADGLESVPDGIEAPAPATRAAILSGLDRLAEISAPGDLVFFYFSGHGSQQPDRDGDEGGGNDEIFLPYDVGSWNGDGVENAIVDDELDARIQRMLDKGVDVFGMIDACNSATGFRAAPDAAAHARQVPQELLGVPAGGETISRGLGGSEPTAAAGRGRAAFFYAAQETEEALELTPKGAEPGEFYGVFTYNVLKRLRQTPNLTYRTLHQAVVNDIKRGSLMATQTPEVEGELLDEPVLRLGDAAPRRQWPTFGGKLQGGELDGIGKGSLLALYADPAAEDSAVVAHARVETAGATKSLLVPVAYPCATADGCLLPMDDAAFRKGRFARIAEPGLDFSLTFSEPVRIDPGDGHDYEPALAAFGSALGSDRLKSRARTSGSGFDVAVALVDGTLAFSAASGLVDPLGPGSSPRLTLPTEPAMAVAVVEDAVIRIARALALQNFGDAGSAVPALETEIRVARARADTIRDGRCPTDSDAYDAPVAAGAVPEFGDCDILSVVMRNTGKKPIDVTALLIGPDFSITPVWPVDGSANRINLGEDKTAELLQMEPDPKASTEERLVFVAVPGVGKSHTAFTELEQTGVRAADEEPLSPRAAALRALLSDGTGEFERDAGSAPARMEEEMTIAVKPFVVRKGAAG